MTFIGSMPGILGRGCQRTGFALLSQLDCILFVGFVEFRREGGAVVIMRLIAQTALFTTQYRVGFHEQQQ